MWISWAFSTLIAYATASYMAEYKCVNDTIDYCDRFAAYSRTYGQLNAKSDSSIEPVLTADIATLCRVGGKFGSCMNDRLPICNQDDPSQAWVAFREIVRIHDTGCQREEVWSLVKDQLSCMRTARSPKLERCYFRMQDNLWQYYSKVPEMTLASILLLTRNSSELNTACREFDRYLECSIEEFRVNCSEKVANTALEFGGNVKRFCNSMVSKNLGASTAPPRVTSERPQHAIDPNMVIAEDIRRIIEGVQNLAGLMFSMYSKYFHGRV